VPNDPTHPLLPVEKFAYSERHRITGYPLECGHGALPPDEQARRLHLPDILRMEGPAAAAAMRIKLDAAKLAVVQGARPTEGRQVQANDLTGTSPEQSRNLEISQ
jgi:hypothetical protein